MNTVAPGVVATDTSNSTTTETGRDFATGIQARKRVTQPNDIVVLSPFSPRTKRAGFQATRCGWTAAPASKPTRLRGPTATDVGQRTKIFLTYIQA